VKKSSAAVKPAPQNVRLTGPKLPAKGAVVAPPKSVSVSLSKTKAKAPVARLGDSGKVAPAKSVQAKPTSAKTKAVASKAAKPVLQKMAVAAAAVVKPATMTGKGENKAKRARVPVDLAAQYGERVNDKAAARVDAIETKTRRPRRDAAARAKLKELLRPDESVVERLARLHSAGTTRPRAVSRRSKHWETRCGKCGTAGKFAGAATLCARCGTILIRAD
jgi:hypothetical protein